MKQSDHLHVARSMGYHVYQLQIMYIINQAPVGTAIKP